MEQAYDLVRVASSMPSWLELVSSPCHATLAISLHRVLPMPAFTASQLLSRPEAVVVMGSRPASSRSWMNLGTAMAFVIMASAFAPGKAEAFDFRVGPSSSNYIRVGDSTSARRFEANEALTVQKTAAGRIVAVRPAEIQPKPGLTTGAAIGALLGGAIGNKYGHGFSRALATGAGAVAGGSIGNRASKPGRHEAVELFIEPDPQSFDPRAPRGTQHTLGGTISVVQDADIPFQVGDAVWVVGSNSRIRIVPREIAPGSRLEPASQDTASPQARAGMADRMQSRRAAQSEQGQFEQGQDTVAAPSHAYPSSRPRP